MVALCCSTMGSWMKALAIDDISATTDPATCSAATTISASVPRNAPTAISPSTRSASSGTLAGSGGSVGASSGVSTKLTASASSSRMRTVT